MLKITDDTTVSKQDIIAYNRFLHNINQCLKFKTYSSIFLNRFEALNLSLMQKMQNRQPTTAASKEETVAQTVQDGAVAIGAAVTAVIGGGVKKKKPKKKK